MLKPKYVHGVNAEEAPKSLLHRLQNAGNQVWPLPPPDDVDPLDDPAEIRWSWSLG